MGPRGRRRGRKVGDDRKVGPPVAVLNRYDAYNRRSAHPLALDTTSPARGSRSALDSTVEMVGPVPRAPRPTLAVCVRLSLSLFVSPRAHPSSRQGSWSAPQTQGTLP